MKIRQCRHYGWDLEKSEPRCNKGCNIESPAFKKAPCFPRNEEVPCEHRSWITQEEIDAAEAEASECISHMIVARIAIGKDGKQQGVVACPKCGGKLTYAVSPSNGHIGAACETSGCLNWME